MDYSFFDFSVNRQLAEVFDIADEEELYQIAMKDTEEKVCIAATKKLADEERLFRIAMTHESGNVCKAAAWKIADDERLFRIAMAHESGDVREAATRKITDEEKLFHIACSSDVWGVRNTATEKLADEEKLFHIATTDALDYVCRTATRKIADEEKLFHIATTHDEYRVCEAAVLKIADEEKLFQIARTSEIRGIREAAAEKLVDEEKLFHIATTDRNYYVRKTATEKLKDKEKLLYIVMKDKDSEVRDCAKRRMKSLGYTVLPFFSRVLFHCRCRDKPLALPLPERARLVYQKRDVPVALLERLHESLGRHDSAKDEFEKAKQKKETCDKEAETMEARIAGLRDEIEKTEDADLRGMQIELLRTLEGAKKELEGIGNILAGKLSSAEAEYRSHISVFEQAERTAKSYRSTKELEQSVLEDQNRVRGLLSQL